MCGASEKFSVIERSFSMNTIFDKEKEYEEQILPLMNALKVACNELAMPMFVSVCSSNSEKNTTYHSDMIPSVSNNIHLKKDIIPDFVNITNGFTTVWRQSTFEFDIEEMHKDIMRAEEENQKM